MENNYTEKRSSLYYCLLALHFSIVCLDYQASRLAVCSTIFT